jgi:MFS family permease
MNPFYNPWLIVFVLVLIGAGLAALTVLCNTMFPDFVRRARDLAAQRTRRAFLVGLINLLFFGLIALGLLTTRAVALRPLGVVAATIVLTFLVIGAAVVALWVGERLRPNDSSVTRQVLAGIVTIELAEMYPLVGWIVVPLVCASIGLGAVILALFQRNTLLRESTTG